MSSASPVSSNSYQGSPNDSGGATWCGSLPAISRRSKQECAISSSNASAPPGGERIDAEGGLLLPGFVDIHTHLDAQVAWDPLGTSSSWHGVTSVVMGNCGVTFAPCKPEDRTYLADMMESVEDIPAESIMAALPWDWETYGDYLDSLERIDSVMNVGGMVGHCALRYWAMGDRSMDPDARPSAAELDEMVGLLDEAMAAGALGFSTSRTLRHKVPDGRQVPGTFAEPDELIALRDQTKALTEPRAAFLIACIFHDFRDRQMVVPPRSISLYPLRC